MRRLALILPLLAFPVIACAAPLGSPSFSADKDLVLASSTTGNSYIAAGSATISGPSAHDLTALAGTLYLGAPVAGTLTLLAGNASLHDAIAGDLRALAGRLEVAAPVAGDEVVIAGTFSDSAGGAHDLFVIAANATVANGAKGPVTIYANNVALGGEFSGPVKIAATGRVSIAHGTHIHGSLDYQAPEAVSLAPDVLIDGGAHFTPASYLPSSRETRALAFASVGVFLLIRILSALLLAGLFAGLFPRLAGSVADAVLGARTGEVVLTALLGFAIAVATPILVLLLAFTFVGIGIAFILGVLYLLLGMLSFVYAGILTGSVLVRWLAKRQTVFWRDGVLGMLVLSVVGLIPYVGGVVSLVLAFFAGGALTKIFYRFAFARDEETAVLHGL